MNRKNWISRTALGLLLSHGFCTVSMAQTLPVQPLEIRQDATAYNFQSQRGAPLSSLVDDPAGSDGRAPTQPQQQADGLTINPPTANQFQGLVVWGSVGAPIAPQNLNNAKTLVQNAEAIQLPRTPSVGTPVAVLLSVRVGAPFVSQRISFLFGSVVPVPDTDENGTLLEPGSQFNYWLPEPHTSNEHSGAGYYWSPHARSVFAIQAGPLDITWRKAEPFRTKPADYDAKPQNYFVASGNYYPLYKVRYYVSGSAAKSPRKMYWTEGPYRSLGKPVSVPAARVGAINIVYNHNFPKRVEAEVATPGFSLITETNRLEETRTLWFDHQQNQILAYNHEGRVFVEILGDNREDGRSRRHLGFEVVDVTRQPNPSDVQVDLGDRVPAYQDRQPDEHLFPDPIIQGVGETFLYRLNIPGSERAELYATRETFNVNDVLVHWLEEGVQGLRWPFRLVRYKQSWPVEVAKYSHYVRPVVANEAEAKQTAVPMPIDNVPWIEYQDAFDRPRAKLTDKFEFFSHLDTSVPAHRTLVRFTSGDSVAFERIFSWLHTNLRGTNFIGSVATNLTAWSTESQTLVWDNALAAPRVHNATVYVGQRIEPPTGETGGNDGSGYWAGYIRQSEGTSFNIHAYADPFVSGFEAANKSAIIPVNAIPGNNLLEIWWHRSNLPDLARGFKPVYWPSVLGRYTISWPVDSREIVLASNDGSGALESVQARGVIYFQNDPNRAGYNPNEEHALMLGGQAFALRDDLNILSGNNYSSHPYVMIDYTAADERPAMAIFKVLREKPEAGILFDYVTEAGVLLQAPMPLPLLPPPVEGSGASARNYNTEPGAVNGDLPGNWQESIHGASGAEFAHYKKFTYRDRKEGFWVYRGVHAGLPALEAGSYDADNETFDPPVPGRAVTGQVFEYHLHVSRRVESLLLTASESTPLPNWIQINGIVITARPNDGDEGDYEFELILKDIGDDATVTKTFALTVAADGNVEAQSPLAVTSFNSYAGAEVTYVGRPPYLAEPPTPGNSFTMRFYYKTQEGFAWPSINSPPAVGAIVPYLRPIGGDGNYLGASTSKDTAALDIVYRPVWPVNPPRLFFGDTLTVPKFGLPAVRGQTSLQILYQQSIGSDIAQADVSAVLHDATREKSFDITAGAMDKLPDGIRIDSYQGKIYFPNLPPHLAERFFFDPNRGEKGHLVFRGEFKDEPVGEKYILLNVLGELDLATVKALCPDSDPNKSKWNTAIDGLATIVETFHENPAVPGTYIPNTTRNETVGVRSLAVIKDDDSAVDSYALSARGPGSGFVTLIAGNGVAFTPTGEPVSVHILRVTGPLVTGELKVIPSANPLNELLTMQHSADLASKFDDFEYDWKIAPPVDGLPPEITPSMAGWADLASGVDIPRYTLGGAGIQVLIDNYIVMRYRAKNPRHPLYDQWSDWTRPQLAEGWIKRVLAGINPFNQRVTDLFNNSVNTDVSILTQAGRRWEGDVALNLENINSYGLIEIYETVLRRGRMLSIEAGINFGPANDALLLAAGYINDLYMMIGNEAWADAANPTIGIGTKDRDYGDVATALFAFKGQMASLLEEELGLLRGRDDFLQPGVEIAPVYNRMFWNYTRGIDSGEVIYALNYNIQENPENGANGVINADDARKLYPQGHGDAYGHFLTAVKGYYSLLMDTDFDWVPRTEAVLVLGQPVQVDYLDERKFAAAAAAVARAGKQVFDLTWRKDYEPASGVGWQHLSGTRTNDRRHVPSTRYWGVDHWAARTGQGSYLNWIVGNAILPETDTDPTHEGIQKVDRTTVPELNDLPILVESLQTGLDNAEAGLNPLGLPPSAIAFDLNPQSLAGSENKTHFEQIFDRASGALNNALVAFDEAKDVTRLMRSEEDSLIDLQAQVNRQELSYTNLLIGIYGTPYPEDIGPGRTYSTGYGGPDLFHFMYVDNPQLTFPGIIEPVNEKTFKLDIQNFPTAHWTEGVSTNFDFVVNATDTLNYTQRGVQYVEYTVATHGFFGKPSHWTGKRQSPGRLQQAASEIIMARNNLLFELENFVEKKANLDGGVRVMNSQMKTHDEVRDFQSTIRTLETTVASIDFGYKAFDASLALVTDIAFGYLQAVVESIPKSLIAGLAAGGDLTSPARGASLVASTIKNSVSGFLKFGKFLSTEGLAFTTGITKGNIEFNDIATAEWDQSRRESVYALSVELRALQSQLFVIQQRLQTLDDAQRGYQQLVAEGERILQEREVYRQRAAAIVQGFRTRDAAFRIFRNEKLERYKTLFDLAAQYAFLAGQAYDYETGLLHTPEGREIVRRIIHSRALGIVKNGEPQYAGSNTGDPGLSSALAEMKADWLVLKGRLGFNNPDDYGTTVSLRTENFRILPGGDSDLNWRDVLERGRLANILDDHDVRRYCMQVSRGEGLPVPGIVIDFGTVIAEGLNVFGKPLAAGDHAYSPSSFATKLYAVGVALEGYKGMDTPGANSSVVSFSGSTSPADPTVTFLDTAALAANPYLYLIPAGVDSMRSPPLGDVSVVRTWMVDDVTIPLPFNIGASDFSSKKLYQSSDSLTEDLFGIRKHQAFRPVASAALFNQNIYGGTGGLLPSPFTNSRLIGRSVWNSKWKLVIPGHTLLSNPNEGLDRFIQSVKDIKLHFVTYSYAGN